MVTTIRRLTSEQLNDYLWFFENVAHTDNKEWDKCYCLDYCATDNCALAESFAASEIRREYAIKYVTQGIIQGYLAYQAGKPVGWCNANDRKHCTLSAGWNFFIDPQQVLSNKATQPNHKIKSIFCFTVAPALRGKGIATALLEKVINDAQVDGYDYLEAYPNKTESNVYYNYVGPRGLYRKFGFEPFAETEHRLVMRKKL